MKGMAIHPPVSCLNLCRGARLAPFKIPVSAISLMGIDHTPIPQNHPVIVQHAEFSWFFIKKLRDFKGNGRGLP